MTINVRNVKPLSLFVSFLSWHWHGKGFSSKRTALIIDVIGPQNGLSVQLLARKMLQAGAAKGLIFCNLSLGVVSVNQLHQECEIYVKMCERAFISLFNGMDTERQTLSSFVEKLKACFSLFPQKPLLCAPRVVPVSVPRAVIADLDCFSRDLRTL